MDMRCYTATLKTEPEEKTERPWVNSIMAKLLESEIQKELDAFKEYAENHSEDKINSPAHYQLDGLDIESIDIIRSVLGEDGFRKFCRGNAIKYIIRADHKGGTEDLKKAVKYLKRDMMTTMTTMTDEIIRTLENKYNQAIMSARKSFEINGKNSASANYFSGEAAAYRDAIITINEEKRRERLIIRTTQNHCKDSCTGNNASFVIIDDPVVNDDDK